MTALLSIRRTLTLLALIGLTACVGSVSSPAFLKVGNGGSPETTGWVVLSLTRSGDYGALSGLRPMLQFRGLTNKVDNRIRADGSRLRADIPDSIPLPVPRGYQISRQDPLGRIALMELPAGEYEFYEYSDSTSVPGVGVTMHYSIQSPRGFSRKFRVSAGEVTYIGNLDFAFTPRTAVLEVHDESVRDLGMARAHFPVIVGKPLRTLLAQK